MTTSSLPFETGSSERALAPGLWFWLYPASLAIAELLVSSSQPLAGLLLHAALALVLIYHSALSRADTGRRLALALLLVPLLRIVALTTPSAFVPLLSMTLSGVGILVTVGLTIRALRLRPREVGLTLGEWWMQLMVMGCGIALGYAGAVLLHPELPTAPSSWQAVAALALALLVFAGFAEELIFRGLLQTVSGPVLGRWGPLYVATVFAVVQLGFGAPLYALLAFIVGLVFAGVVRLSGSIIGVALAHGVASIVMLLVMPYARANPTSLLATALPLAMLIGGVCAGIAVLLFALARLAPAGAKPGVKDMLPFLVGVQDVAPARTRQASARPPAVPAQTGALLLSASQVTRLRRAAQLTYIDLAARAGLPARLLAEIELGLVPLDPESALRLADGLGILPQELQVAAG
ncbi:MAG: CPBP family glutamic-type intramembrane protease [Chloroflexaceae bacterium]